VILWSAFAFELPAHGAAVIAAGEHACEEALLRRPSGVRLPLPIAARHGVVEPTVRGILIDVDIVALAVLFEAVAKSPHVVERNEVVGLAEGREYRARELRNQAFERLRLPFRYPPLARRGRAVPHDSRADRHLGRKHERMAPSLAIAGD